MNTTPDSIFSSRSYFGCLVVLALALVTSPGWTQPRKTNPTSKLYVVDLNGQAQINTGDKIDDLAKKSVYNAQGTVIETKPKSNNAMVFSDGTGSYFAEDTRVEIKTFTQEPFTPNRNDMEVEPSISQTRAFVARGAVGLCTSKKVAGSSMVYETSHGSVNIRGKKVVVEANDEETKISMIEGESTVKGGEFDLGGQTLKEGEQAIIRRGPPGKPSTVSIIKIPDNERQALEDKVTLACAAKQTVYFEVRERSANQDELVDGNPAAPSSIDAFTQNETDGRRRTPITLAPANASVGMPDTTVTEFFPIEIVPERPPSLPVSVSRLSPAS